MAAGAQRRAGDFGLTPLPYGVREVAPAPPYRVNEAGPGRSSKSLHATRRPLLPAGRGRPRSALPRPPSRGRCSRSPLHTPLLPQRGAERRDERRALIGGKAPGGAERG